jgi:hypothetical protein
MTLVISKGLTLDNGTRAAAIAGISPTLDYRFAREKREIETVSLTDKLTYTGGNGTFVGSDGFIQPATTNVPRFDHDPLSRQSLGLLSEGSRENLFQWSNSATNGETWNNVGNGLNLATGQTDPANGITAIRATDADNVSASTFLQRTTVASLTAGSTVSYSAWIKPISIPNFIFLTLFANVVTDSFTATFSTSGSLITSVATIAEGSGSVTSASFTPFPGGWYRCAVTGIPSTVTMADLRARINLGNYQRVQGTARFDWYGAQLEVGSSTTSYVPTSVATVTRTADSAVIDGTGVLTGTYTLVEKPAGCAVVSGSNINLQPGFTAERVMVFPAALDAGQITAIRGAM